MSDEIKMAEVWYTKEGECPYCGEIQDINGEMGDIEQCEKCGREFEISEFIL